MFIYNHGGVLLILLVYVDDILLTGNSVQQLMSLLAYLNKAFALKDLGPLNYFFGIEAKRHGSSLHLSQSKYAHDLLIQTKMQHANPISSPIVPCKQLSIRDGDPMSDPTLYRSTVGALQYLTLTRPDIQFAVNKACQFMHSPTLLHWQAVKRILRYLRGTIHDGLTIHGSSNCGLIAYSDADWASNPDDRKSTSGYCIFMGPNLILWCAQKQSHCSFKHGIGISCNCSCFG